MRESTPYETLKRNLKSENTMLSQNDHKLENLD